MEQSVTLNGSSVRRWLSFVFGLGMMVASFMTIDHFFAANYPASIWAGSFCDIGAFFNCDSSAFSEISQIGAVPLGYFGLMLGALVSLGAVFPTHAFERTNKTMSLMNIIGWSLFWVIRFSFSVASACFAPATISSPPWHFSSSSSMESTAMGPEVSSPS